MTKILEKLILIFKAKSLTHLIKIFFIFGLAGSLSLYLSELFYNSINMQDYIKNIYEKKGYLDKYGGSVVIVFLTLLVLQGDQSPRFLYCVALNLGVPPAGLALLASYCPRRLGNFHN